MKPILTPFFRLCPFDEAIKAAANHQFNPKILKAYKHSNGFIEVSFSWNSDCNMKYVTESSKSFGDEFSNFTVEFPDVKFRYKDHEGNQNPWDSFFSIEIGLKVNSAEIEYTPLFIQNRKYEVAVYFAPYNWEDKSEIIWEQIVK